MILSGLPVMAAAWLAAIGAFGATAAIAAYLLLRDLIRAEEVTAKLEAEAETLHDRLFELADSEERYRSLVEAQADYIVRRDDTGRVTFANEGYSGLVGIPRHRLIGSRQAITPKETRPVRVADTGTRVIDEAVEVGDSLRWISWIEVSVPTQSGGIEVQRVGRDVTDRVAGERALETERARAEAASEAKSRFLATVSHEVRTPLNGVLGMTDLLSDTGLTPEQTTYARALKTSGEALLSLIDGILDFSKIEAGKLELTAEPFDLHDLVEGIVELMAPRAQGKGIEIASFVASDIPRRVVGDADRLRQVLMNLAVNAVKFTDCGGVGVRVTGEAAGRIAFEVADTGIGIPADRLSAIFREFEQADDTASRRHGGTGLGLSISGRIVERMGGTIAVRSELGEGSVFSFALALRADHAAPTERDVCVVPDLAGLRITIVAQSPFEARFMAQRLGEAGASVDIETNTAAAEAALARRVPDIVIADCALGEDAARALAATARKAGVGRVLVLLSPFERREFGSPGEAGFDGYLVKPVRPRSLFARLNDPAPAVAATPPGHATGASSWSASHGTFAGRRVLLAEDNEINALLALKTLEWLGASTDWARDGAQAVALVQAALTGRAPAYDLVLMDVRMPGLDGLEATRRIRRLEAAERSLTRLPIVALTANAYPEDRIAACRAGVDDVLAKPLDRARIAALAMAAGAPESIAG